MTNTFLISDAVQGLIFKGASMRRTVAWSFLVFFVMTAPVYAQQGGGVSANGRSPDHAIRPRLGDWFATLGRSDEEKKQIMTKRQAERKSRKAKEKAERAKQEAEEKKKKMNEDDAAKAKKVREKTEELSKKARKDAEKAREAKENFQKQRNKAIKK